MRTVYLFVRWTVIIKVIKLQLQITKQVIKLVI